jgi:uncharacterized protein (UPF0276 family)
MDSPQHRLGIGFNGQLLVGALPTLDGIHRLEAGTSLYFDRAAFVCVLDLAADHSLHLARAPFSEDREFQEAFISYLIQNIPSEVSSIGLHLSGPYNYGLGYFGLGTEFVRTATTEQQSARLVARLLESTGRHILIENANYYHESLSEAARVFEWTNSLCTKYDVGLILDLAHLVITAHNLNFSAYYLLGLIDVEQVEVIHISGIVEGRNGVMHDGHNRPVHELVWSLLDDTLRLVQHPITVVLEHTDACWADMQDAYRADWLRLQRLIAAEQSKISAVQRIDHEVIGIGYMANIVLPQRFPQVVEALGQEDFSAVVQEWGTEFLKQAKRETGKRFFLRDSDTFVEPAQGVNSVENFRAYLLALAGVSEEPCA